MHLARLQHCKACIGTGSKELLDQHRQQHVACSFTRKLPARTREPQLTSASSNSSYPCQTKLVCPYATHSKCAASICNRLLQCMHACLQPSSLNLRLAHSNCPLKGFLVIHVAIFLFVFSPAHHLRTSFCRRHIAGTTDTIGRNMLDKFKCTGKPGLL